MISVRYTRNLFLRTMCVVYLFAFISFYIQIPGLYGDNGILPAKAVLENSKHKSFSAKVHYQPTLLWLSPYLGLDTNYALDFLALLGSFLAFTGFISQKFCAIPLFAGLWSLYFSLYQVGQIFVSSQWDNLLLEAGFLALLVAPLLPGKKHGSKGTPKDYISLWLVKWLLFRFILSSGLVKLLHGCPKFWNLTALNYYFERTVLPTPLSWYAHHIPTWFLKLTTVFALASEIVLPFLFFVPLRSVRITVFVVQLFLQIAIYLTGNFNFLNILVTTMLITLLDDQFFFGKSRKNNGESVLRGLLSGIANIIIHAIIIYGVVVLYNFKFTGSRIETSVGFTRDQLNTVVKTGLLYSTYIGLGSLGYTVLRAVGSSMMDANTKLLQKILSILYTISFTVIALTIFFASTVPLLTLHTATNTSISPSVRMIYNRLSKLHVVNQYGILDKIGGITGREELVLEGSNNIGGPWREYNFLYKPGNVNNSLPFVAPYSPRIDWQMWWAAQSTYDNEPWLLSLTDRLLNGNPEVLALIDRNHCPFIEKPPKYIRGVLYTYKYTTWNLRWQSAWWKRERVGEYFPAFSKDSPALQDTLRARNLLPTVSKQKVHPIWKQVLDSIRMVAGQLEATLLMWSVFTAGCAIITTTKNK